MTHDRGRVWRRSRTGPALVVGVLAIAAGLGFGLALVVGSPVLAALGLDGPGRDETVVASSPSSEPGIEVEAGPRPDPSYPSRSAARSNPEVPATIAAAWEREGGERGWLGQTVKAAVCAGGSCTQEFVGGWVSDGSDGDAYALHEPAHEEWQRLRGPQGFLGLPAGPARCEPAGDEQTCEQRFEGATLGWSTGGAARVLDVDDPSSLVVVVNKSRPMQPKDFVPDGLSSVGGAFELRTEAAEAFAELRAAAKKAGAPIRASSGYRSFAEQRTTYDGWVADLGRSRADELSARAGYSEHQTGLAVDLHAVGTSCQTYRCFGDTEAGSWVAEHAHEYGFLIRFQKGEEDVTGYDAEPWHLRYVGRALAEDVHVLGTRTLEAHLGLPAAPTYKARASER